MPGAWRNGLQSTILPLPVCAQTMSPNSKGRRCKVSLSSAFAAEETFLRFLSRDQLFCCAVKLSVVQ